MQTEQALRDYRITRFNSLFAHGYEPSEAEVVPFADLLREHKGQKAWSPYHIEEACRARKDYEGSPDWCASVHEIDLIDHDKGVYDPTHLPYVIDALERAECDVVPTFVHASRSGLRLIVLYDEPRRMVGDEYEAIWAAINRGYVAALDPLIERWGLHVDSAPADWTRLWRVPFFSANTQDANGKWSEAYNTFNRPFLAYGDGETVDWDSLPEPAEEDRRQPVRHALRKISMGALPVEMRLAHLKLVLPALREFLTAEGPMIGRKSSSGWNDRFCSVLASVALRLGEDDVDLVLEAMLDQIEELGGDRDEWFRRRATHTLEWARREKGRNE